MKFRRRRDASSQRSHDERFLELITKYQADLDHQEAVFTMGSAKPVTYIRNPMPPMPRVAFDRKAFDRAVANMKQANFGVSSTITTDDAYQQILGSLLEPEVRKPEMHIIEEDWL